MSKIKNLRPGILVSIRTHQTGNRSYQKREIERAHLTEGGVERSRWDTVKIVYDPEEAKEASQVNNRARYLVTRLCAETAHGPLCPTERREELYAAIEEARTMVADFNARAAFTRLSINVICGEIVADDVNTARALFSETEDFMRQMQEGLKELDVKKVRALCLKTLDVGQMLSPDANAAAVLAVNAARDACRKIVAAGEQAAIALDQNALETIALARSSFLDFGMDMDVDAEVASFHAPRALDFEPDQESA